MTLPDERARAVETTYNFMLELLDPKKTPRIPKAIRTRAYWCLRHYPSTWHIEEAAKKCPDIFEVRKRASE